MQKAAQKSQQTNSSTTSNSDAKNPLALSDFNARSEAIGGKLRRLEALPQYQKMNDQQKAQVRSKIYDRYVVPSFGVAGKTPIDKQTWLNATGRTGLSSGERGLIRGAAKGATELAMAGTKIARAQFAATYGLADYFFGSSEGIGNWNSSWQKGKDEADKRFAGAATKSLQSGIDNIDFLSSIDPKHGSFISSASEWTGEQVAQLPFYEALGGMFSPVTGNLTKQLSRSKVGQWTAKRVMNAAEGYTAGVTMGEDNKQASMDAAMWAGTSAIGSAASKIGGALWAKAAKKFTANIIAVGGKPLQQELTEAVLAEAKGQGHGIKDVPHGPDDRAGGSVMIGKDQHMLGDVAIAPTTETTGHFITKDGKIHPYNSAEERQQVYDSITKAASVDRAAEDPVSHKMHETENHVINTLAQNMFKKDLMDLSESQMKKVAAARAKMVEETAQELAVHVPDLTEADAAEEIQKEFEGNPELAARSKELANMFGLKSEKEVAKKIIKQTAQKTGMINPEGAAAKVNKVSKKTAAEGLGAKAKPATKAKAKGTGLKEGASASLGLEDFKAELGDTVAYFKNPTKASERRAADGTLVGGRDKRTWNERLKAENTAEFVETLKQGQGGRIKFEDPKHLMLFNWSNRKELPDELANKLRWELKKAYPKYTPKELDAMADRGLVHLQMLAQSGRLAKEGNVFKSSKFFGAPTGWQTSLNTEIDRQELRQLKAVIKYHPNGLKAMKGILQVFQSNRAAHIDSIHEWQNYNKAIQMLTKGVIE